MVGLVVVGMEELAVLIQVGVAVDVGMKVEEEALQMAEEDRQEA